MISRRTFLKYTAGTTLTWYAFNRFGILQAIAQIPGGTLNPNLIPKFQSPLLIPPVMPKAGRIVARGGKNVDYYEISMKQFSPADSALRPARHHCLGLRRRDVRQQERAVAT